MTTHSMAPPDPAPARRASGWWLLLQFAALSIAIPLALAALARWLLAS